MGLDTVELVLTVENTFGIEIPDGVAAYIRTVGELHGTVIATLEARGVDPDPAAIYAGLSALICKQLGVKPEDVVPSARFIQDLGAS